MENNSIEHDVYKDLVVGVSTKVTLFSVLLICSLVGNLLVIAVVYWNIAMRTNFNYVIVNMAVSDLLIPLVAIPVRISQLTAEGPNDWFADGQLGNVLCKVCFFLADISPVVSVLSLVIIAINRYLAVSYPVHPPLSRPVINRVLLSITWIVAMALFSPYLVTFRITEENGRTKCINIWPSIKGQSSFPIFIGVFAVVSFIIPSICIVMLYSLIIYKLHENSRNIASMLRDQQRVTRKRKNNHISFTSLLIVIAFIGLWGPFYVFVCLFQILWQWNIPPDIQAKSEFIHFLVTYMGFLNSAVNPCIYFFCLKNYRQGLKHLLWRVRTRGNSQLFGSKSNPRSFKVRHPNSMHNQQSTVLQMVSYV